MWYTLAIDNQYECVRKEIVIMILNRAKLRDITFRKGLTQRAVAIKTGIAEVTVNGIYNGRSTTQETAQKIAEALVVDLESIIAKGDR